ncbi:hypothetical protein H8D79_01140 [PVC group bacterium]|nr:hypothetical protein [PVC group bacterium]
MQHILDEIDELPESERELLDLRLAERAEAKWRQEAKQTRREAKARGIDHAAIDEAIRKHRYGA